MRKLAVFYGISLDYFLCDTQERCHAILSAAYPDRLSPTLHAIAEETERLSPKGKRNALRLLGWIEGLRKKK